MHRNSDDYRNVQEERVRAIAQTIVVTAIADQIRIAEPNLLNISTEYILALQTYVAQSFAAQTSIETAFGVKAITAHANTSHQTMSAANIRNVAASGAFDFHDQGQERALGDLAGSTQSCHWRGTADSATAFLTPDIRGSCEARTVSNSRCGKQNRHRSKTMDRRFGNQIGFFTNK